MMDTNISVGAKEWADSIQSVNRAARRKFQQKNKIPFKIYGTNIPLNGQTHGSNAKKEII